MNRLLLFVLSTVVVLAGVAVLTWFRNQDPAAARQRMISEFLACVPDSLDRDRRDEIVALFDNFYEHADRGDVDSRDVDEITEKVERFTSLGAVSADSLAYLMAQVGYYTYKMDPRKNLAGGEVDHPMLNPAASSMELRPDSTFWAEFEEWKRTHVTQKGDTVIIKVDAPTPPQAR